MESKLVPHSANRIKNTRILNAWEVDAKMEMGLCILCDKPFTVEHQRAHKNIRIVVMEKEEEEPDENEDKALNLSISTETNTATPTSLFEPVGTSKATPRVLDELPQTIERAESPSFVGLVANVAPCLADRCESFGELKESLTTVLHEQDEAPEGGPPVADADAAEEGLVSEIDNTMTLNRKEFIPLVPLNHDPVPEIVDKLMDRIPSPIPAQVRSTTSIPCFNFICLVPDTGCPSCYEFLPFLTPLSNSVISAGREGSTRRLLFQPSSNMIQHPPPPEPPDRVAVSTPFLNPFLLVNPTERTATQHPGIISYMFLPTTIQVFDKMPFDPGSVELSFSNWLLHEGNSSITNRTLVAWKHALESRHSEDRRLAPASVSIPGVPPSYFMIFWGKNPGISGALLEEYDSVFVKNSYHNQLDDLSNVSPLLVEIDAVSGIERHVVQISTDYAAVEELFASAHALLKSQRLSSYVLSPVTGFQQLPFLNITYYHPPRASLDKGDTMVIVNYNPVDWKLGTTYLNASTYPLTKGSLLLFHLVKLMVVLHRKMINRGSVLVTKVLVKWRDLPPKHGTWEFYHNPFKKFIPSHP